MQILFLSRIYYVIVIVDWQIIRSTTLHVCIFCGRRFFCLVVRTAMIWGSAKMTKMIARIIWKHLLCVPSDPYHCHQHHYQCSSPKKFP